MHRNYKIFHDIFGRPYTFPEYQVIVYCEVYMWPLWHTVCVATKYYDSVQELVMQELEKKLQKTYFW